MGAGKVHRGRSAQGHRAPAIVAGSASNGRKTLWAEEGPRRGPGPITSAPGQAPRTRGGRGRGSGGPPPSGRRTPQLLMHLHSGTRGRGREPTPSARALERLRALWAHHRGRDESSARSPRRGERRVGCAGRPGPETQGGWVPHLSVRSGVPRVPSPETGPGTSKPAPAQPARSPRRRQPLGSQPWASRPLPLPGRSARKGQYESGANIMGAVRATTARVSRRPLGRPIAPAPTPRAV